MGLFTWCRKNGATTPLKDESYASSVSHVIYLLLLKTFKLFI